MGKALEIFKKAASKGASDIFVISNRYVSFCIGGEILQDESFGKIMPEDASEIVDEIYGFTEISKYGIPKRQFDLLMKHGSDDFSVTLPGVARFRVNVYFQRNSKAAVIRVIQFDLPRAEELGIPEKLISDLAELRGGLVLITGAAGSGKSTTLASIVDRINSTQNKHIITLEDPIEYLHRHKKSIVSQREIGTDAENYIVALKAALRQKPDVIMLGEMRDYETISIALTAAETGHLVLSSLHTMGAPNSIERMIDAFPTEGQNQVRYQLSMSLKAVVSQQLIPALTGTQIPAFEIMYVNSAVSNQIRIGDIKQISNTIATSSSDNMITMNKYIEKLYKDGKISEDVKNVYTEKK
ncbi:MAG: PilT/PilU family type 4a pilus ATPase [Oscillospiraceae bacterium]|nr:PilT/PilU family type 4a pilus ATPase [Oscillospiraceae bacterium]